MKKNLITFFAVLVFLMQCIGPMCYAAENDNVIFELDFDEYDGTNPQKIVDKAGNTVQMVGNSMAVGDFFSLNQTKTRYLDFSSAALRSNMTNLTDNLDELTVETWQKLNASATDWSNIFSIGEEPKMQEMAVMRVTWYTVGNKKAVVYKGGNSKDTWNSMVTAFYNMTSEQLFGKWNHFVFTRKYNTDTKKWTVNMYVNGAKIATATGDGVNKLPYNNVLAIGLDNRSEKSNLGLCSTFKVYNEELTLNQIKEKYDSSKNEFEEIPNRMNFVSITPKSGDIPVTQNSIEVKYDNIISEKSIYDGISFEHEDGTFVQGGYNIKVNRDSFKITFGKLKENENYKLKINNNLKSVNDIAAKEIEFTYHTVPSAVIIDEDFQGEDYVVDNPPPSGKGITYSSPDSVTVCEEGDEKFIKIKGKDNANASVMFDNPFDSGVLIAEIGVRGTSDSKDRGAGNMPRDCGRFFWDRADLNKISDIATIDSGLPKIIPKFSGVAPFESQDDADENGFYNVKFLIKKLDNGFDVEMSNMLNPERRGRFFIENGGKLAGIMLAHIFSWGNDAQNQLAYDNSQISFVKIYESFEPKILFSDAEGMNPKNRKIKITFNDDMLKDSITYENISIINKSTEKLEDYEIIEDYDDDLRSVVVELKNHLDFNTTYEIKCENVFNSKIVAIDSATNYSFTTEAYDMVADKLDISDKEDEISICVEVANNRKSAMKAIIICAAYDTNGRAAGIETETFSIPSNSKITHTTLLKTIKPKVGQTLKAYIFDCTDDVLKPVSQSCGDK